MKNRFSPYTFRNGKTAPNRVVVPPMASQTADTYGLATAATVQHYRRLARSGAGLVFVEYSFVHPSGRGEEHQLGAHDDDGIPGLSAIAAAIHAEGALAGLQIVHAGGKSATSITGQPLQAPSAIRVPVKGWEPDEPQAMTGAQIVQWTEWFRAAAVRAAKAGFDIVEVHAAHGYGLNQWLSPLTNRRDDEYGGSLENRARLLSEVVDAVKTAGLITAARLPGQDHMEGGLSSSDMSQVAQNLALDLIDVSSGIGGWRRLDDRAHEGYLIPDARHLKHVLPPSRAVIGVGGIETGAYIDSLIVDGAVDFTAVGRALLKDPVGWGERHLAKPLQTYENKELDVS